MGTPRIRSVVGLVAAAMVLGVFTLSPVAAHFTTDTRHLGNHAWKQVIKQKADKRYLKKTEAGAPVAGASVAADGTLLRYFNRFGGPPTINKLSTGAYTLTFPGMVGRVAFNNSIALVSLGSGNDGMIQRESNDGDLYVFTYSDAGAAADRNFDAVVFLRGALLSGTSSGGPNAPDGE